MKQDIKNNYQRKRQAYVPASVKVIEVTAQRIICQSGGTQDYNNDNLKWWGE